jgi:hypothetical protein
MISVLYRIAGGASGIGGRQSEGVFASFFHFGGAARDSAATVRGAAIAGCG